MNNLQRKFHQQLIQWFFSQFNWLMIFNRYIIYFPLVRALHQYYCWFLLIFSFIVLLAVELLLLLCSFPEIQTTNEVQLNKTLNWAHKMRNRKTKKSVKTKKKVKQQKTKRQFVIHIFPSNRIKFNKFVFNMNKICFIICYFLLLAKNFNLKIVLNNLFFCCCCFWPEHNLLFLLNCFYMLGKY